MSKKIFTLPLLLIMGGLTLTSCSKIDWLFKNGCEVSSCHLPYYDNYNLGFEFPFQKVYDASGNLKEIDCSFWNVTSPSSVPNFQLLVHQKGTKLYFLHKQQLTDTAMIVTLDHTGRVASFISRIELNSIEGIGTSFFFTCTYQNGRFVALNSKSPVYDNYGNVLSFASNSYQYDYTRKAPQQFYMDDYMQDIGFYLLEYLNFFPEMTSPVNLRTHKKDAVFDEDIINHKFDSDGKLISYEYALGGTVAIVWKCRNNNK